MSIKLSPRGGGQIRAGIKLVCELFRKYQAQRWLIQIKREPRLQMRREAVLCKRGILCGASNKCRLWPSFGLSVYVSIAISLSSSATSRLTFLTCHELEKQQINILTARRGYTLKYVYVCVCVSVRSANWNWNCVWASVFSLCSGLVLVWNERKNLNQIWNAKCLPQSTKVLWFRLPIESALSTLFHMDCNSPNAHYFLWSEVTRCVQLKLNTEHVQVTHDLVASFWPKHAGKFITNMLYRRSIREH